MSVDPSQRPSVSEVLEIHAETIQKSPSIGSRYNSAFIEGLVKVGDDFAMIINIGKAFSTDEVDLLNLAKVNQAVEQNLNAINA